MVILGMLTDTLRGSVVGYKIDNPIGIEGLAPVEKLPVFGVLGSGQGDAAAGARLAVVAPR
jgi:hypothetical protein